jgi:hypothetical protein
MSTLAGEFWVCGDCRSINNAGARQCYNCRTPRDRAAVDPSQIDPSTHGRLREIELPEFRSSRWAAMLATVLILAVAILQVVQFNLAAALIDQILGGTEATVEQFVYVGSVGILGFGVALLALIAWALWLSRTVTSMPALGLGYPAANGMMAFVENFIPILNLYRVPAIVRDVVRRLEPKTGGDETMTRGEALVFAAWISIIGGYLVPRVLGFFTSDVRTLITISGIGTGLVVVGAIFLVVLIWWIEGRILRRRETQLAEGGGTAAAEATAAATPTPAAPTAPDVVQTRSAFAATATVAPTEPATLAAAASSFRLPGAGSPPPEVPLAPVTEPTPEPQPEPVAEPSMPPEPVVASTAPDPIAVPEPATALELVVPKPVVVQQPEIAQPPADAPEPVVAEAPAQPQPEPAATPAPIAGPIPAEPIPAEPVPADPVPAVPAAAGPPNLTIRISTRGMMTAEMDGELEHVMLDDLGPYAEALSHVGGTATIVVPSDEGMPGLISKRAQRILEDAGVQVTIP